jgi:Asp-tRNA(Asn)/Glu-tRNA(Gln) amidotransferase C subunit
MMIKDVFHLKKNSWHSRLMNYIWGFEYCDFTHICPYFWLSILNVLIIGPVALIKGLAYLWNKTSEAATKKKKQERAYHLEAVEQIFHLVQQNEELLEQVVDDFFAHVYHVRSCPQIMLDVYNQLRWDDYLSGALQDKLAALRKKYDDLYRPIWKIQREIDQLQKLARIQLWQTRKQKINELVKLAKPLGKILFFLSVLALAALCIGGTIRLVQWLSHLPQGSIIRTLVSFAYGIVVLALAGTVIILLKKFIWWGAEWLVDHVEISDATIKRVKKYSLLAVTPFIWVGKGFILLGQIIYALYKNNCPAINWQ